MKILIADSGATKTDWCLTEDGEIVHRHSGLGISPVFQTQEEIVDVLKKEIYPVFEKWDINAIYFYGTGCTPENIPIVQNAIHQSFSVNKTEVYSDLVAAAHSLCGHNAGIACILGTGSNSCEWDGNKIVNQVSPLGFILGDEGSGASMGKRLLGDALKNQLTPGLKEKLLDEYDLTPAKIIDRVYRQPFPSRFLASFSPFINYNIADESIIRIVIDCFNEFLKRNVMQYNFQENKVNFVGSIAWHYADMLKVAALSHGMEVGKIVKSPMEGLIEYYFENK